MWHIKPGSWQIWIEIVSSGELHFGSISLYIIKNIVVINDIKTKFLWSVCLENMNLSFSMRKKDLHRVDS